MSRPVTYLTWRVVSTDKKQHEVSLYYDNSAELVVNDPRQAGRLVAAEDERAQLSMRIGSKEQPVLQKAGDDLRIDWGHLYVAAPNQKGMSMAIAGHEKARLAFAKDGSLPETDDTRMPRAANDDWPVTACMFDLGSIGGPKTLKPETRLLMLAYDDEYSIEYLGTKLCPYWRRNGMEMEKLLITAANQYGELSQRCAAFEPRFHGRLDPRRRPGLRPILRLGLSPGDRRPQTRRRLPTAGPCSSARSASATAAPARSM